MVTLLLAAALAAPTPPWEPRPGEGIGQPYRPMQAPPRVLLIAEMEAPGGNPRTEFRLHHWRGSYYIARETSDGGGSRERFVSSVDCPAIRPLLAELGTLRLAPLEVEGISPRPQSLPESSGWRYSIGGEALHPTGQGGEMHMITYQVAGAPPDPLARWVQSLDRAVAACVRN